MASKAKRSVAGDSTASTSKKARQTGVCKCKLCGQSSQVTVGQVETLSRKAQQSPKGHSLQGPLCCLFFGSYAVCFREEGSFGLGAWVL